MKYSLAEVRKMLLQAFNADELEMFCADFYPEVLREFSSQQSGTTRVQLLIDQVWVSERSIDEMLKRVQEANPYVFQQWDSKIKGGRQRTKRGIEYLPYLCDRNPQESVLKTAILAREKDVEKRKRPLVCFIHGSMNECHETFTTRLALEDSKTENGTFIEGILHRLLERKVDVNQTPFFWPAPANLEAQTSELKSCLKRRPAVNLSGSQVEILHTYIGTAEWTGNKINLLSTFINHWHDCDPLLGDGLLIVCVCIKYDTFSFGRYRQNSRMRAFLKGLQTEEFPTQDYLEKKNFAGYPRLQGVVLPELKAITMSEATQWPWLPAVKAHFTDVPTVVTNITNIYGKRRGIRQRIFSREPAIPMEDLVSELKTLLSVT